jgi:hypothetical protein
VSPRCRGIITAGLPGRCLLPCQDRVTMEDATLVLAIIPPLLAAAAEYFNPISHRSLDTQSLAAVDTMGLVAAAQDDKPDGDLGRYRKEKRAAADTILYVAKGVTEASGLIPTWISVSTSAAVVFHELKNPTWWYFSIFVAASVFAIGASVFFSHISFLELSTRKYRKLCFGARGNECLSRYLILFNFILIGICLSVWEWG